MRGIQWKSHGRTYTKCMVRTVDTTACTIEGMATLGCSSIRRKAKGNVQNISRGVDVRTGFLVSCVGVIAGIRTR